MNKMWVRLSLAFSAVMLLAAFLPTLGMFFFSDEITASVGVMTLPAEFQGMPPESAPLGVVTSNAGAIPLERLLLFLASASLVIGTIAGLWVSRSVSKPATRLVDAVQAIGKKDLGYRVPEAGSQELVDLARAINQMAGNLENAEKIRRSQLADVTHELRTPLTVLQGNLKAMLDGVYTINEEEIKSLYGQAEHLGQLVNDLHLLALAEAGQLPNAPQAVNLPGLVKQVAGSFDALASESGIRLECESAEDEFSFEVDPRHIQQILHNLLSNAIKNTPRGGTITVDLTRDEQGIRISVADTGRGIPSEELHLIFDRFYRRDEARRRGDAGGSGLGLTITKKIVDGLGGMIDVWSDIGKGSVFSVYLPTHPL